MEERKHSFEFERGRKKEGYGVIDLLVLFEQNKEEQEEPRFDRKKEEFKDKRSQRMNDVFPKSYASKKLISYKGDREKEKRPDSFIFKFKTQNWGLPLKQNIK